MWQRANKASSLVNAQAVWVDQFFQQNRPIAVVQARLGFLLKRQPLLLKMRELTEKSTHARYRDSEEAVYSPPRDYRRGTKNSRHGKTMAIMIIIQAFVAQRATIMSSMDAVHER